MAEQLHIYAFTDIICSSAMHVCPGRTDSIPDNLIRYHSKLQNCVNNFCKASGKRKIVKSKIIKILIVLLNAQLFS